MLTVYTKPNCVQCVATKRLFDGKELNYELVDVSVDGDALLSIMDLGYLQVPVVVTALGEHWSGFRPDKIGELV